MGYVHTRNTALAWGRNRAEQEMIAELKGILKTHAFERSDIIDWATDVPEKEPGEVAVFLPRMGVYVTIGVKWVKYMPTEKREAIMNHGIGAGR